MGYPCIHPNHYHHITIIMRLYLLCICITLYIAVIQANVETIQKRWKLMHSFDGGVTFLSRGVLQLQASDAEVKVEMLEQTEQQPHQFHDLYQLKLIPEGESHVEEIITTVPACQVRRANFRYVKRIHARREKFPFYQRFLSHTHTHVSSSISYTNIRRDEIILHLNDRGQALSVTYLPRVSPLAPKSCINMPPLDEEPISFTTTVSWETDTPGMKLKSVLPTIKPPPGLHFIKRSTTTGSTTEGVFGEKPEAEPVTGPFSFVKRYWYIILPVFIAQFMSADPAPSTGAAAAASGTTAAAAAAAAASSKRRGKRD